MPSDNGQVEVMPGISISQPVKPKIGSEEIENRFGFHKATIEGDNATLPQHTDLRLAFREFAEYLDEVLPNTRNKMVAFENLESASMWSHKAIAEAAPIQSEGDEDETDDSEEETI